MKQRRWKRGYKHGVYIDREKWGNGRQIQRCKYGITYDRVKGRRKSFVAYTQDERKKYSGGGERDRRRKERCEGKGEARAQEGGSKGKEEK